MHSHYIISKPKMKDTIGNLLSGLDTPALEKNRHCGKQSQCLVFLCHRGFSRVSGMAVQFILGRSGTGKTHHCVRAIVDALFSKTTGHYCFLSPSRQPIRRAMPSSVTRESPATIASTSCHSTAWFILFSAKIPPDPLFPASAGQWSSRESSAIAPANSASSPIPPGLPGLGKRLADTIAQLQQYANTPRRCQRPCPQAAKTARRQFDIGEIRRYRNCL